MPSISVDLIPEVILEIEVATPDHEMPKLEIGKDEALFLPGDAYEPRGG
jgi:hypothetical protein